MRDDGRAQTSGAPIPHLLLTSVHDLVEVTIHLTIPGGEVFGSTERQIDKRLRALFDRRRAEIMNNIVLPSRAYQRRVVPPLPTTTIRPGKTE